MMTMRGPAMLPALILLAACASAASMSTSTAAYLGPVTTPITVGQFEYDPPPAGHHPTINWRKAYAACQDRGTICDTTRGPSIVLALVTSSATGETSGGRTVFTFQHQPSYVLTWTDPHCHYVPAGPVSMPDASPARPWGRMRCTTTTFVDADTGRGLYTVQIATP